MDRVSYGNHHDNSIGQGNNSLFIAYMKIKDNKENN